MTSGGSIEQLHTTGNDKGGSLVQFRMARRDPFLTCHSGASPQREELALLTVSGQGASLAL
jgi:hypothetical protein